MNQSIKKLDYLAIELRKKGIRVYGYYSLKTIDTLYFEHYPENITEILEELDFRIKKVYLDKIDYLVFKGVYKNKTKGGSK